MLTRSRARSIGWAAILGLCLALTLALTFRVNAVKSQVRLTERHILALKTEKGLLETEFETRANQQQLRNLNDVEFGYQAPTAAQYLESERQLAALGKPSGPGAPEMIRVARADPAEAKSGDSLLPAMVNPLTGKALAAEVPKTRVDEDGGKAQAKPAARLAAADPAKGARAPSAKPHAALAETLGERLARVENLSHVEREPRLVKAPLKTGLKVGAVLPAKGEAKAKPKAEAKADAKSAPRAVKGPAPKLATAAAGSSSKSKPKSKSGVAVRE